MPVKTHQRELKSHTLLGYFDFLHAATKCVFHSWCCVSSRIKTESQNDAECAITDIKRNTSLGGERKKRRIHSSQMSHSAPLKYLKRVYIVLKTRKYVRAEGNNWIHTQVGRSHVQCALGLDGR